MVPGLGSVDGFVGGLVPWVVGKLSLSGLAGGGMCHPGLLQVFSCLWDCLGVDRLSGVWESVYERSERGESLGAVWGGGDFMWGGGGLL